jgi:hypothetical protein
MPATQQVQFDSAHHWYNQATHQVLAIHVSQTPAPFCRPVGVMGWDGKYVKKGGDGWSLSN